jgi:hypothetical protein
MPQAIRACHKTADETTMNLIRSAARRAVDQAPKPVPGSAQWQRLAAIIAEIPVSSAAAEVAA